MMQFSKFRGSEDGAAMPVFAVLILVVLGIAGGAIDALRANSAREELQHALDASVLMIASSTDDERLELGMTAFHSNIARADLKALAPQFTIEPDGTVEANITGSIPTTLLKTVGIDSMALNVHSSAGARPGQKIEMTFAPVNAKGIYDKEIFIFVRNAAGAIVSLTKVLDYDFMAVPGGPVVPGVVTTENNLPSFTVTVDPGNTYGLMMRVWPDVNFTGLRNVQPIDYYSDTATQWIQTTGICEAGQRNSWEDTGDWDYIDFVYDLTCTSTLNINPQDVRLLN